METHSALIAGACQGYVAQSRGMLYAPKLSTLEAQEIKETGSTEDCHCGGTSDRKDLGSAALLEMAILPTTIAQTTLNAAVPLPLQPILNGLHLRRVQVLKCLKDVGCCLCCSCVH